MLMFIDRWSFHLKCLPAILLSIEHKALPPIRPPNRSGRAFANSQRVRACRTP
jgi:hypothetical protein